VGGAFALFASLTASSCVRLLHLFITLLYSYWSDVAVRNNELVLPKDRAFKEERG